MKGHALFKEKDTFKKNTSTKFRHLLFKNHCSNQIGTNYLWLKGTQVCSNDWLIDYIAFYAVSAIFRTYKGGVQENSENTLTNIETFFSRMIWTFNSAYKEKYNYLIKSVMVSKLWANMIILCSCFSGKRCGP